MIDVEGKDFLSRSKELRDQIVAKRTEYQVIVKNNEEMLSEIENRTRKLRSYDLDKLIAEGVDVDLVLSIDKDRLTKDGVYAKEKSEEISAIIEKILGIVESKLNQ